MSQKICFVVMGFGKKMDYENSKEVDLDMIYKKVIKELFEKKLTDYELILSVPGRIVTLSTKTGFLGI
jgi:hypothetical protein